MCKTILTESLGSIRPHCGCGLVYILRVFRAGTKVTSGRFWSWFLLWITFCRCLSSWRFFFSCLCCSFLCLFDTCRIKKNPIRAPHIYAYSVGEEHSKIVALWPYGANVGLPLLFVRCCHLLVAAQHCNLRLLPCMLGRILKRTDPGRTDLTWSQAATLH